MAILGNKAVAAPAPTQPQASLAAPKTKEEAERMSKGELVSAFGNKSNAIRGLNALGFTKGQIAKKLEIIYQHARNVLVRPLKREVRAERDAKAVTNTVKV